jgi:fatty-acyl-CoA synthase
MPAKTPANVPRHKARWRIDMTPTRPSSPVAAAGRLTSAAGLAEAARQWPERLALVLDDERLTWSELHADALIWARALKAAGVGDGSHVGLLMPNCADYVRLFYAAGMLGAVAVMINARFKDPELAYAIAHAEIDCLFIGGHALPHLDFRTALLRVFPDLSDWRGGPLNLDGAPKLKRLFNLGDPRETDWPTARTFLAAAQTVPTADVAASAARVDPGVPALIMYSSGTTAHPKACMLTHRNLSMVGAAFAERFGLGPADRVMNPLPFFHMSTMLPMAACRLSGAAQICTAHFDPARTLRQMEEDRVSFGYLSFPTLVNQVIAQPDFATRDLSALRFLHCVGPADLMRKYRAAFPQAHFVNAYGLTEASGVPCYTDPADPADEALSISGRPFDGVSAKAVDPETLQDLPCGERGEIWLAGWCLFAGYYADAAATAEVLTADGWLRTGDLGRIDARGRITFDGRLKDMLKIGGENVSALEIETVLCAHPAIQVAQVVPVPDDHLFEVAAAFVELAPGGSVTPAEAVAWCAARLASYKVPRYVRIVTDWPMSTTKVQKFRLPRDFTAAEKIDPKRIEARQP